MTSLQEARKATRSRMLQHYAGVSDDPQEKAIAAAQAAADEANEELELQYEVCIQRWFLPLKPQ